MFFQYGLSSAFVLSAVLGVAGCGEAQPERNAKYPVVPASGVLLLDGKPLPDADLTFVDAKTKQASFGRSDSEGRFRLTTFRPNDGAVVGTHVVTVSKLATSVEPPAAELESEAYVPPTSTPAKPPKRLPRGVKPAQTGPAPLVPVQYTRAESSNLQVVIGPDGDKEIRLQLTGS